MRGLGYGAKRTGGRSRTGWSGGIRSGPSSPRRDYNSVWQYSDAAGRHLDSDYSEHRPGIEFSESTDAWQQHTAL